MIRRAQQAELEQLSELARRSKAHWGYSAEFMAACRDELCVRPELLPGTFVNVVAGVITGFYAWSPCGEQRAELEFLFVEPSAIGCGYGRQLFEHACDETRRAGCLWLEIQGDPNAAPFYTAMGARKVGERESASVPGRMLPLYELSLSQAALSKNRTDRR